MRTWRFLLVAMLCGVPVSGHAISSFSLESSDILSSTSFLSSDSLAPLSGLTFTTVTVGTVSLALEIEEMKPSAQSPHHNVIAITGGVQNTTSVSSNFGLVTVQQTAGGANVTMALNNIVVSGGLASTVPSTSPTNNPTLLLVGIANEAFTVTNSYWFAQTLNKSLLVDAFIQGSASATNAIAEDVLTVGMNEFSPHHNLARSDTGSNNANVSQNFSLGPVQQLAGFGNVTQSLNTLLVGTGTTTLSSGQAVFGGP